MKIKKYIYLLFMILLIIPFSCTDIASIRSMEAQGDVQSLIDNLDFENPCWMVEYSVRSLGNIGERNGLRYQQDAAVEKLINFLKDSRTRWFIKIEIALALGKIGDQRAINPIEGQINSCNDNEMIVYYLIALDYFPPESVEPVAQNILMQDYGDPILEEMAYKIMR